MDTQHSINQYSHTVINAQDDEIDLFELVEKLWKRRLTIVVITATVSLVAIAVALLLPSTWQAETRVDAAHPAQLADLHDLQQQVGIDTASPDEALVLYGRHLNSQATWRTVFQESGLAIGESNRVLATDFEDFKQALSITVSNLEKDARTFINVSFDSQDQPFSARLLNDYLLPSARAKTIAALTAELEAVLTYKKNRLLRQITGIERQFSDNLALKTLELTNALETAKAGNLTSLSGNRFTTINTPSLFMLGTDVLTKQLEQQTDKHDNYRLISTPKTNDAGKPLLAGVLPLYLQLQQLDNLTINLSQLQPVTIDEPAFVPATPIKPKKPLIAALGVVLGGMLGVFVALIQIALANRERRM